MKEYLTLRLNDGETLIVVDQTLYNNNTYFLTVEILEDNNISDDFIIYIFNEKKNELINLEDENLKEEIMSIFNDRLNENSIEYDLLENINANDFISLTIKEIKDNLYILEYEGNIIEKYLEFFTNTKPKVNDIIYISKNLLDIKLLSYGHFVNYDNITEEDVMIIKSNNYRVLYRRLYG